MKDDYFLFNNTEKNAKRLKFNKGNISYTIREAFKVYEIAQNNGL